VQWMLAEQAAHRERAGVFEAGAALRESFFGNAAAARESANAALQLSNDREVEYGAGLALAISGDSSLSSTLAEDLEKRFPEDTSVRFSYLPALRAMLALNQGKSTQALELLQAAAPYELGSHRSSFVGLFGNLYPSYVRGEAYLAAHRGVEAAAEFRKILEHRGIVSERSDWRAGVPATGPRVRDVWRPDTREICVRGFPQAMERRRSRHIGIARWRVASAVGV
jgi:eukaryotic-like serine/threonine-protein kinase